MKPYLHLTAALFVFGGVFLTNLASAQSVVPVSRMANTGVSGAGASFLPMFSRDGAFVIYVSHANNLVTNDEGSLSLDLFRSPVYGGPTELLNVSTGPSTGANADCLDFNVSHNGVNVAFASRASNLTTTDTNNAVDVFLRYGSGGATPLRLVSADPSGHSPVDPLSHASRSLSTAPQISELADRVVFVSAATNLVLEIEDANGEYDVFVRDGVQPTRLVSRAASGMKTGNGTSHSPRISESGQFVTFISTASDLIADGPTNSGGDIYWCALDGNSPPVWLSQFTCGLLTGTFPAPPCAIGVKYRCVDYALSGDGQHFAYIADTGPNTTRVLLYTSVGATNATQIAVGPDIVGRPQISQFGEWVAYSAFANPQTVAHSNVYLWNRVTGSNILVSVNTNGLPGNDWSHSPVMDATGDYVAFLSRATDLVPGVASPRFQIYLYERSSGQVELVSANTNGLPSVGDFETSVLSIVQEGPVAVAFDSTASDLVTNDLNGVSDVFVRVFSPRETRLLSRQDDENVTPLTMSGLESISGDGRVIAYTSMDDSSVPTDTNSLSDLYVRNLVSGHSRVLHSYVFTPSTWEPRAVVHPIVSRSGNHVVFTLEGFFIPLLFWRDLNGETNIPVASLYWGSFNRALSKDGTFVVYVLNRDGQVWERIMPEGPTNLISVAHTGDRPANNVSSNPVLSPNDRWVVFQSAASDIVYFEPLGGGTYSPPPGTLYVRDLLSNTSKVASITASNIMPVRGPAVFSADSQWIGYVITNGEIYVRQIENTFRTNVCASCDQPSLSGDASFVAYQAVPTNGPSQIYLKNMRTGFAKLISASISGAEGNGPCTTPQITGDGRFIVFESTASNLVENDNNNASDIFLGDRLLGKVLLLSINRTGSGSGNGASSRAILSADGRTVVFQSLANDLIAGDYNDRRDVFVATLSLPDSDSDGMDDDFEVTYFGNLERNGGGDMDNDGHTDQGEFLAGTNPTDNASILRVVSISAPGGTTRQLVWFSTRGRTYSVQFKDSLADNWSTLPGSVRANASTATATDDTSDPHRFYRVVMEP